MNKRIKFAVKIALAAVAVTIFSVAGVWANPENSASVSDTKATVGKAPKAVFPQMKLEFEPVFEGTEINHDFVVENQGDAPLVIKSIRPD